MDQREFLRQMEELVDFGRTKENLLTKQEIADYCSDWNLTEEQMPFVYAYLKEHRIEVEGYRAPVEKTEEEAVEKSEKDSKYLRLYKEELCQLKRYEEEELVRLLEQLRRGEEEVISSVIEAHLHRVMQLADKYRGRGVPVEDLIQEGNLGLMIAVEKFNPDLGYRFSTYASWWIKQAMFKAISEQSHCMKIPVYIQETLSKFSKVKAEMERAYNCQVTNKDVAQKMNLEPEKVDTYLSAYTTTVSIEGSFDAKNGSELNVADVLEDETTSVEASIQYEELKKEIANVVSTLKEREQSVIKMRFGLENFARTTLEDIGKMFGVTKECIRQTEMRALNKLRGCSSLNCYAD